MIIYPDNPLQISELLSTARLMEEKQFETEFAYIFVAQAEGAK
jgi:hypothetical protein